MEQSYVMRSLTVDDRDEYGLVVHASFNACYWRHGWGRDYFQCSPAEAGVFFDIYNGLTRTAAWHCSARQPGNCSEPVFITHETGTSAWGL